MSLLIWKGPTNALVYQPTAPRLEYSDRVKSIDIYAGPQVLCAGSMLARGTFGTFTRAGWVVTQCTCDTLRGTIGLLTITWEAGGSVADQPLPVGDFSLEPQELYPKVERNPFFSGIEADTVSAVYNCLYAFNQTGANSANSIINTRVTGPLDNGNAAGPQTTFANELLAMLQRGEESYYIAGYRYSYESYSYTRPSLSTGGFTGTPAGPLSGALPPNIAWLRLADKEDPAGVNGSMYKLTVNWLGGPNGFWDPNLYP